MMEYILIAGYNMIYEVYNINSKYYRQMMDVIVAAKVNPTEKGQVHHIVPRCWYKHYNLEVDNSISNTVLLTYEDHKLVHSLAYKCGKESWFRTSMAYCYHFFGEKAPEYAVSEETKHKQSVAHKRENLSEETRAKLRKAAANNQHFLGNKHTEETKKQIGNSMKKYLWYTDGKVNIRSDKVLPAPFHRGRIRPF